MSFFDDLTNWLNGTSFYQKHMSNWPAPLNDASFDIFLLLVVMVVLIIPEIKDRVSNHISHRRIKEKSRLLEERRLDEELARRREADSSALMDQYLKFMLIANMKNMGMDISFEDWKKAKLESEPESISQPEQPASEEPAKKRLDFASVIDAVKDVIPAKPAPVEETESISSTEGLAEIKPVEVNEPSFEDTLETLPETEPVSEPVVQEEPEISEAIKQPAEVPTSEETEAVKEEEVKLTSKDILPATKMVSDIPEGDDVKVEMPIDLTREEITASEEDKAVEEEQIQDINEILAKKAKEEGAEPIQISESDVNDFDKLMGAIKNKQKNTNKVREEQNVRAEQIEKNRSILNSRIKKSYTETATTKTVTNSNTTSDVDAAKAEAVRIKEKELEKERKRKERLAKRKKA